MGSSGYLPRSTSNRLWDEDDWGYESESEFGICYKHDVSGHAERIVHPELGMDKAGVQSSTLCSQDKAWMMYSSQFPFPELTYPRKPAKHTSASPYSAPSETQSAKPNPTLQSSTFHPQVPPTLSSRQSRMRSSSL